MGYVQQELTILTTFLLVFTHVNGTTSQMTSPTTITTTVLRPFFRDHPGKPVPEENFWTLWCKGRLTEADTLTIWLAPLHPD